MIKKCIDNGECGLNYLVENSLSLYERNFNRLMDLLPDLNCRQGHIVLALAGQSPVRVEVLEQNPYTTTIHLRQGLLGARPWVGDLRMKVRIYHDARVAEVIACQGIHSFQPFYPYPNPKMLQPYEKRRVNHFLGEWLSYCLVLGCWISI
jgi:uncharacterized protein YqiB (DUF1249 family)